jgi:hypothetical protein
MKNFSYTKSSILTDSLTQIEKLRENLLLTPISPGAELSWQWQAILNRFHFLLAFNGYQIDSQFITRVLSSINRRQFSNQEKLIVNYKKTLDYLYQNWLVNSQPVTAQTLNDLFMIIFGEKLIVSQTELDKELKYIQINPEHPILQAALAQFIVLDLSPYRKEYEIFSHFVFLLFLYKFGYDFRRLLVLEKFLFQDIVFYKDLISQSSKRANLTAWLEYILKGVNHELTNIVKEISIADQSALKSYDLLELNQRQRAILGYLDQPGLKIDNKTVQKQFKVSQITASRDLAKLTTLGLLFSIGKGRSTYYTKV